MSSLQATPKGLITINVVDGNDNPPVCLPTVQYIEVNEEAVPVGGTLQVSVKSAPSGVILTRVPFSSVTIN